MTLHDAIKHARAKAEEHTKCAHEHAQLADWLEELRGMKLSVSHIRDLKTDNEIVTVVDELKHRIRSGVPSGKWSEIRSSLDRCLREFIDQNGLGWDQHSHARMPLGGNELSPVKDVAVQASSIECLLDGGTVTVDGVRLTATKECHDLVLTRERGGGTSV